MIQDSAEAEAILGKEEHGDRVDLLGQRILITGASSGIGRAACQHFANRGASVAMIARRESALQSLARELGSRAFPVVADVSDSDSCGAGMEKAFTLLGGFDTVINSAGVAYPTPLESMTRTDWTSTIDVNLSGTFYVAWYAALRMRDDRGGAIVNISSELGSVGMKYYAPYCASKAGVIGLTRALAVELAPSVRVNAVCPGPVDTPMMDAELDWFDDPTRARREAIERIPLRRFATAGDVVGAIDFLAYRAPAATGAILALDGGTTSL